MSEPKINYLGPADEADTGDRRMSEVKRYWIEPSRLLQEGWHPDDTCVVKDRAHDRVVAERDALQLRLNAADDQIDILSGGLR